MANAFYAQSGGVTAVINASACGLLQAARKHRDKIQTVFVGRNGIVGALTEDLYDTTTLTDAEISALRWTPGGAFGSCRYKLKGLEEDKIKYERLFAVFKAHDIQYFFYNGGGDSQDTANKVAEMARKMGYPLTCIGIPKTIDNDLAVTDNSPGFGSVAKYVAVSIREAGLDVASMAETSTKVFVMEVMGRHAGWIAAAAGLASDNEEAPPHIILFPEIPLNREVFLAKVDHCVKTHGYCTIVVSEGVKDLEGNFIADAGLKDAFGHTQLGGVAPVIAQLIKTELGYKYHWAVCDYLQRAARHIASVTDVEQAYAVGEAAVLFALAGKNAIMPTIVRESTHPYRWHIGETPLSDVANVEKKMPKNYIQEDGFSITPACRDYLEPLIMGEDYPPYEKGLPHYIKLHLPLAVKKLDAPFTL
ncbi:MAG: 6-phosphofructokinase [Gammaproteobacteria bacterium]|nr:6-phosphofructokinase [Gammaproteobacteria bacterium]